eukprot:c44348_g1_i1 orf=280-501(+)
MSSLVPTCKLEKTRPKTSSTPRSSQILFGPIINLGAGDYSSQETTHMSHVAHRMSLLSGLTGPIIPDLLMQIS